MSTNKYAKCLAAFMALAIGITIGASQKLYSAERFYSVDNKMAVIGAVKPNTMLQRDVGAKEKALKLHMSELASLKEQLSNQKPSREGEVATFKVTTRLVNRIDQIQEDIDLIQSGNNWTLDEIALMEKGRSDEDIAKFFQGYLKGGVEKPVTVTFQAGPREIDNIIAVTDSRTEYRLSEYRAFRSGWEASGVSFRGVAIPREGLNRDAVEGGSIQIQ